MKELYEFNNLVSEMDKSELTESEPVINSNDFGAHRNLQDVDLEGLTYLETSMAELIGDMVAQGLSASKAKTEVDKAIKELVKAEALPELPSEDDIDGKKTMWVHMAKPKVKAHLQLNGVLM